MSFSIAQCCRKGLESLGLAIYEQMGGTLGNPEGRIMKGSSWENFQFGRERISSLKKK